MRVCVQNIQRNPGHYSWVAKLGGKVVRWLPMRASHMGILLPHMGILYPAPHAWPFLCPTWLPSGSQTPHMYGSHTPHM